MIKQSLIYFFLISLVFSLFIFFIQPAHNQGQSQWQRNVIQGQTYLYSKQEVEVLMLGTSLSQRLKNEYFSPGFYNLSLAGLSLYEGLALLGKKGQFPKTLLIESNYIFLEPHPAYQKALLRPLNYASKKNFVALRDRYRPISMLAAGAKNFWDQIKERKTPPKDPGTQKLKSGRSKKSRVFQKMIADLRKKFQKLPPLRTQDEKLRQLKKQLEQIREKGTRIIFFEMPIDCSLIESPLPRQSRNQLKKSFPPGPYNHFPQLECREYPTTDGQHLGPSPAQKYAGFLQNYLKKLDE